MSERPSHHPPAPPTAAADTPATGSGHALAPSPLPRSLLAAYGSLAFPLAAAFVALQVIVPTWYAESTSLGLGAVGVILLVARLADTVTDPLVGWLSDRSTSRWGRRKVWVVAASPLLAVSVLFLFNPPDAAGAFHLLVWTVAIYVAGTLSVVPASAWGAELSPDYHERSRIAGTRVAFGLAGTLAALALAAVVGAGASEAEVALGDTLAAITALVLVSLLVATLWAGWRVPDRSRTRLPANAVRAALAVLRTANPFRQLLVAFFLNAVGNAIPATLFLLYVTHVLDAPGQAGPLLFVYFVCAALAVPFWVALAGRIGKHRSWGIAIVLACLFFVWTPFLSVDSRALFWGIVVATGLATGADLALPSSINADVIDWDEAETGYRRPGLFFALWGTATKLSYALAIGVAFPLLALIGFETGGGAVGGAAPAAANTAGEIRWLAVLYGGPCIAFKLAALFVMRDYPITAERHAAIRADLVAAASGADERALTSDSPEGSPGNSPG